MGQLEGGQIGVNGDGFDAANNFEASARGLGVLIGQTEAEQDAGHLKVMLCVTKGIERLSNEKRLFCQSFFQGGLGLQKNRGVIRGDHGFPVLKTFKFAMHGLRQQLSKMLLDELGDFVRS